METDIKMNNPPYKKGPYQYHDEGFGLIIGLVAAIILVILFFLYVLPAFRINREAQLTAPEEKIEVQFH